MQPAGQPRFKQAGTNLQGPARTVNCDTNLTGTAVAQDGIRSPLRPATLTRTLRAPSKFDESLDEEGPEQREAGDCGVPGANV